MNEQQQGQTSSKSNVKEDLEGDDCNKLDCHIEETINGMFKLPMYVAPPFYGGIIGQKGTTKRRIESEARCNITIPQINGDNKIIISGKTREDIAAGKREIQQLIDSLRKRNRPNHFYGIALNFGEIREKFTELKAQILSAEIPGIEESLFQTEGAIHFTFGICVLMDKIEKSKALEILQSCREFLNDLKPPFTVHVSGLEIMNNKPSSARVLYAKAEAPELQIFADRCFKRFNQSGLGIDDFNRGYVKLHMTVMNNRYRDSKARSFDASEILQRWGNFDFGTIECKELLLCVMGASREANEFYKTAGSLEFEIKI